VVRNRETPAVPPIIERFVKSLVVTAKAVTLYPPASNIPLQTAEDASAVLREALQKRSQLRLAVTKNALLYHDEPLFSGNAAYSAFAFELYNRHLAEVRFHSGTQPRDLVAFLSVLKYEPAEIEAAGGIEARLWDQGVGSITVTETQVTLVDGTQLAGGAPEAPAMSQDELDEAVAAAYGGSGRDRIAIARFVGDPPAVARYLTGVMSEAGEGPRAAGERFSELAEVARETASAEDRGRLLTSLGAALAELDPGLRRELLFNELLPEARTNESLAELLRELDLDEVCRLLVEDMDESQVSQEGLARAIRTLAQISMADRDDVVAAAGAAMHGAGVSAGFVSGVFEMAAPSHVTVRERAGASRQAERPAEAIFRLMDLAPTPQRETAADDEPGRAVLAEEARRGITDGDVIMALVSLVTFDIREQQFASTMSMLEDSLDLLVSRGEIDIAADAADALRTAAENPSLAPEQKERLRRAVGRLGKPADVRAVAHALRLHDEGSVEHESARRLLDALGPLAIEPLLEQLADESDMGARKALVDLLTEMAPDYIAELGAHVSDPRWFVVRNVVSALGPTHSSAALPYLERTLHHREPRVRREVIRALSGIHDRVADEMLIVALSDDDAQNVQLAARYLGVTGVAAAVPALEQVARGDGRGSRDTGPRVEAIEALGKLGAAEALPTLETIASKRSIIGGGRARELRTAAEHAIAQIKVQGGAPRG
jgi:HEAT repeat protein